MARTLFTRLNPLEARNRADQSPDQPAHAALDNGVALYDLQRWYQNHLPDHPLMAELLAQGWQLLPWSELLQSEADLETLSKLVNLFSEGPDWLSPELYREPAAAAEMAEIHADWLIPPEPQ